MPPPSDRTSLHWPDTIKRSIVFPEDAFGTREEADTDAVTRAKLHIAELNGTSAFSAKGNHGQHT